ncbi:helix-turn-helix domain-containing protein [Granulicella sp. dw_53]|uniref:helix-turn-helix domain-containing protein n=1 Tax=Granulicella sp. dw_53 TaxID=2719792 RepID=UPI001BD213B5|nr:helix-turn-helix domain-containing protein [Granulicella sp. dw_53]
MSTKKVQPTEPESLTEVDEYLKVGQVAKTMHCSATSVYRLARTGVIPAFTHAGMVRIPRSGLHAWLKANTTPDAK